MHESCAICTSSSSFACWKKLSLGQFKTDFDIKVQADILPIIIAIGSYEVSNVKGTGTSCGEYEIPASHDHELKKKLFKPVWIFSDAAQSFDANPKFCTNRSKHFENDTGCLYATVLTIISQRWIFEHISVIFETVLNK